MTLLLLLEEELCCGNDSGNHCSFLLLAEQLRCIDNLLRMRLAKNSVGIFCHLHLFLRKRRGLNRDIQDPRGSAGCEECVIFSDLQLIPTIDRDPTVVFFDHHHPQPSFLREVRIIEFRDVARDVFE
ncbi:MAG: hypothetical protein FJ382_09615 [Verrucomicrobia bacterium]|nr:hypothetical protein [Verrucomicrobiota bacterium]